jgi:hypothetical protein
MFHREDNCGGCYSAFFLIGRIADASLALLFAPQSGRKMMFTRSLPRKPKITPRTTLKH